jgi:hypothetical protein
MPDPCQDLASALSLHGLRRDASPPLVFVCGGRLASAEGDSGQTSRKLFLDYVRVQKPELSSSIRLAEDVMDQETARLFTDLLVMENTVAGLAAVIVVFVESPGAIAELGAFSVLDEVRDKLLLVVDDRHFQSESFIRQGPIQHVESVLKKTSLVFPWIVDAADFTVQELASDLEVVATEIKRRQRDTISENVVNPENDSHRTLLIADIVCLLGCSTEAEIKAFLKTGGVETSKKSIRTALHVLRRLKLVDQVNRGSNRYYVSNCDRIYLRYSYEHSTPFKKRDKGRWMMRIREFIKNENPERYRAWRQHVERMSAGDSQ